MASEVESDDTAPRGAGGPPRTDEDDTSSVSGRNTPPSANGPPPLRTSGPVVPLLMAGLLVMMAVLGSGPFSGFGPPPFVTIVSLLFAAELVYAGITAIHRNRGNEDAAPEGETGVVEHLKRRYVDGELSEAEFEQKLERYFDSERNSERRLDDKHSTGSPLGETVGPVGSGGTESDR